MPEATDSMMAAHASTDLARLWDTVVGGDLAFVMARANAISVGSANAALATHGLKVRSYSVLALAAAGTRPTQKELSEFLKLDPSQIVSLIDQLETRELVRREPNPSDRRVNVVVVTEAGRALYEQAREATQVAERSAFAALSADDLTTLASLVRTIANSTD
ncbi:MarR family transcriptional regulator [Leifsonia kafniensis]|uniref:MarR family transcriptional regulator n=1 Tax=Leifsonia kafniensis TaxID=475957 RepID=A0ABP7KA05_9MICO